MTYVRKMRNLVKTEAYRLKIRVNIVTVSNKYLSCICETTLDSIKYEYVFVLDLKQRCCLSDDIMRYSININGVNLNCKSKVSSHVSEKTNIRTIFNNIFQDMHKMNDQNIINTDPVDINTLTKHLDDLNRVIGDDLLIYAYTDDSRFAKLIIVCLIEKGYPYEYRCEIDLLNGCDMVSKMSFHFPGDNYVYFHLPSYDKIMEGEPSFEVNLPKKLTQAYDNWEDNIANIFHFVSSQYIYYQAYFNHIRSLNKNKEKKYDN